MLIQLIVGAIFTFAGLCMIVEGDKREGTKGVIIYFIGGVFTVSGAILLIELVADPKHQVATALLEAAL